MKPTARTGLAWVAVQSNLVFHVVSRELTAVGLDFVAARYEPGLFSLQPEHGTTVAVVDFGFPGLDLSDLLRSYPSHVLVLIRKEHDKLAAALTEAGAMVIPKPVHALELRQALLQTLSPRRVVAPMDRGQVAAAAGW